MRELVLAVVLGGLGIAAAGCGGSHTPAVANLGMTTTTTTSTTTANATASGSTAGSGGKTGLAFSVAGTVQEMRKFAACMRANGEPTFPDPNAQGVISAGSLDRGSPQFARALDTCRKTIPNSTPSPAQQAQNLRQAVAASACMRRNGVPNFPDPQTGSGGGLVIRLRNIDPSSPQFQRAQRICGKEGLGGKA